MHEHQMCIRDRTHIGDETEVYTTALHKIANIVGTVMGYAERGNLKLA